MFCDYHGLDTMKLILVLSCLLASYGGAAFAPMMPKMTTTTQQPPQHQLVEQLHATISRREALIGVVGVASTGAASWAREAFAYPSATPSQAGIGSDHGFANDFEVILAAQQPTTTGGKEVDVNAAPPAVVPPLRRADVVVVSSLARFYYLMLDAYDS
jgi:hypothetical protein